MNKCKQQNPEEQQLNGQFQEATATYQNCPSQEHLSALNVLKEKLEHLYEKKGGRHNHKIACTVA